MIPSIARRLYLVLAILALFAGLVVVRLVSFQFGANVGHFTEVGETLSTVPITLQPPRGYIYDRNGELLATNLVQYTVGVSPSLVTNPEAIADAVNEVLGIPKAEVLGAIVPADENAELPPYVLLARPVTTEQGQLLIAMKNDPERLSLYGLQVEPFDRRAYPGGQLAAHVIGFTNLDNVGNFGVEGFYDELLAGHPISALRPVIPFDVALDPEPDYGSHLYLTIDREIQYMVEQVLRDAVERYGADRGTIIVMDPRTGEILAMASVPTYDPNRFAEVAANLPVDAPPTEIPFFNPAVSEQFEPGSGFKVLTMAAALQSGIVTPQSTYYDNGALEIGGIVIRNWDGGAWGTQDMTGLLAHSLNVGAATLSVTMGPDAFYSYMTAFSIGQPTNVDLAGEARGRLKRPGDPDWNDSDLATNSFGQGVAVTPIQLITAISAVANRGAMMQPHLLYLVDDRTSYHTTQPQVLGRPISAEVALTLNEMLAVSLESESSNALVPGYRIAGKTGTAEIPTQFGYSDETVASFIGWGPVDDPRFIVLVKLDKPDAIWGSETAAPTFAEVVRRLVILMEIPPDDIRISMNGQGSN